MRELEAELDRVKEDHQRSEEGPIEDVSGLSRKVKKEKVKYSLFWCLHCAQFTDYVF